MAGDNLRVVVTGATGNVGSALVTRLLGRGDHVVGVARRCPAAAGPGSVEWAPADLTQDEALPRLREAVRGADAVVHLAWGFQPSHRLDHLEELGVGGTRRVAEAVVAEGVPHLLHMSSVGAYSPRATDGPVAEDYPREGVSTSPYSRHKAAAERLLDLVESEHRDTVVTRVRPGIIGQRGAGSALLRYAVPGYVPAAVLRHLPLLPMDGSLSVPVVHVDDVADAVLRVLDRRAGGAFNLAADDPLTADLVAGAFGARRVPLPAPVLRGAVAAAWHARLLQLDPGWVDLAFAVPLLDTGRARSELGWAPRAGAAEVIADVVDGMASRASRPTPVLRPRSAVDSLRRAWAAGPVHRRLEP